MIPTGEIRIGPELYGQTYYVSSNSMVPEPKDFAQITLSVGQALGCSRCWTEVLRSRRWRVGREQGQDRSVGTVGTVTGHTCARGRHSVDVWRHRMRPVTS